MSKAKTTTTKADAQILSRTAAGRLVLFLRKNGLRAGTAQVYSGAEIVPAEPGPCLLASILVDVLQQGGEVSLNWDREQYTLPYGVQLYTVRVFCQPRAGEKSLQCVERTVAVGEEGMLATVRRALAATWFRGQCVVKEAV